MPGRIKEHPERRARLVLVLDRPERDHCRLGGVEIVDVHVDVHLLRPILPRPLRRHIAVDLLEGDRVTVVGADRAPVVLVSDDLPAEQRAVELGERPRVGAVQDDDGESARWP